MWPSTQRFTWVPLKPFCTVRRGQSYVRENLSNPARLVILKRTQKLYRCKSIIVIFIWRVTRDYPYNPFNSLLEMSFEGIRPKKGFPYFEISLWYSRNNKFWLLKPILNSFKTNFNCVKFSHQMHFIILFGIHKVENKCHDFCFSE